MKDFIVELIVAIIVIELTKLALKKVIGLFKRYSPVTGLVCTDFIIADINGHWFIPKTCFEVKPGCYELRVKSKYPVHLVDTKKDTIE